MKYTLLLIFLFSIYQLVNSQELACNISLSTSKLQGSNREIFTTLEESLNDFINNRNWTNYVFEPQERIECNFMLNILEASEPNYKGTLQVQARRPVYGSSYSTVMLNYIDEDIEFKYEEFDALEFSENTYLSNLTSILAYYVYMILALDFDSFSPNGGTVFFQKAEKVVTNAQTSGLAGWRSGDNRNRKNRYWFVESALKSDYSELRDFTYRYHRLGLDALEKNVVQGRNEVFESVKILGDLHKAKPDPFMAYIQLIFESKSAEIVQIFSEAPQDQKTKVYNILTQIDPSGGSKYESLRQ